MGVGRWILILLIAFIVVGYIIYFIKKNTSNLLVLFIYIASIQRDR